MTHYYQKVQTSPVRESTIKVHVLGKTYHFHTASGLFSRDHLDVATRLLIEHCEIDEAKSILDLGCGWGVVAITLADQHPQKTFFASDISDRAVAFTKKNVKLNKTRVKTISSDLFKDMKDVYVDCILTNPPYVAGREVCFRFIIESFLHLNKSGSLQLVARHTKGGKILSQKMQEVFGNVATIVKSGGFRIYKSIKE